MRKQMIVAVIGMLALAGVVCADSYTYSLVSAANSTNTSDAVPVSGYLDKIEMSINAATCSNNIMVATYDGTTPIDKIASNNVATFTIVRPRVQPTDYTGTVIPAATATTDSNTVATVLSVVYDKILIGGNVKIYTINPFAIASTNKVVIYYEPLKK